MLSIRTLVAASGPHYLYRPRPGVKACLNCGLTGLLVITEERELWEQRLVELYAVMTEEYKFVSVTPLSLLITSPALPSCRCQHIVAAELAHAPINTSSTQMPR